MMLLRELKEREEYKNAKYVKYIDEDGMELQENKIFNYIHILRFQELPDNGLEVMLWICNTIPNGWKIKFGISRTPNGFRWISNGESPFGKKYKRTLLRV